MSLVAFVNGEKIIPWAEHHAQGVIRQMWRTQAAPMIQPDVFFRSDNYFFYVRKVQRTGTKTSELDDIMIYEVHYGQGFPSLTTAKRAWSKDNVWYLEDGVRRELDQKGFTKLESPFKRLIINLKRPFDDFVADYRSSREMGMVEMRHHLAQMKQSGIKIAPDMLLELHFKIALPLACLVVGLCSAPLGLKFARSGSFMGILLSIIVVFLYHNTMLLAKALGTSGVIPPILAAWAPNIIFATAGLYLIWRER
jgi:lipopolysaccharide export system permease protein